MIEPLSCRTHYRTHTCGQLRLQDVGVCVVLSGWVDRKRNHGGLLFLDLRDHYGRVQCLWEDRHPHFSKIEQLSYETVISLRGRVVARPKDTCNPDLATGEIEVIVEEYTVLSVAQPLPFPIVSDSDYPEETRLAYRFLDLRRPSMHQIMVLRSQIIAFMRNFMVNHGFLEIQTPILTATSPEGARDYVVPSRLYPGEFYALPQAPQQFKQLLMAAGFDRYFQIAPCFRDESSRADRSPGEFYQLDMEMAFVRQEDVWAVVEPLLYETFRCFAPSAPITPPPFVRIPYDRALAEYGSDKPDLRNPLRIRDYSTSLPLPLFTSLLQSGGWLRGIVVQHVMEKPKKFFKDLQEWALAQGAPGLGIIGRTKDSLQGPLLKFCSDSQRAFLQQEIPEDGALLLVGDWPGPAASFLSKLRNYLGNLLGLIDSNAYAFCWITDFPMYEREEETGALVFSHNPFSMPQGGMEALCTKDPLTITAYQYDIVCNGLELSSGAIRNHLTEVMIKAFSLAGYDEEHVEHQFGALLKAFRYGVPPHGGSAPGIDRIVMLLTGMPNLRETIPFPLNQQARDMMMGAPCALSAERMKELHLTVSRETKDKIPASPLQKPLG